MRSSSRAARWVPALTLALLHACPLDPAPDVPSLVRAGAGVGKTGVGT